MFLIFPPVAKPCEPPAGVALLSAALKGQSMESQVFDANIQGLLYLIRSVETAGDAWTHRALKNRERLISDLKDPGLYENPDRYHQRVYDLNHLLSVAADPTRFKISLSDYSDNRLSSVNSKDLLKSATLYRENPFYPFFQEELLPRLREWDHPFVGISLCYLNQALVSFALAGWIKACFPAKKLIMGGGLISSWSRRPGFDNPFSGLVDRIVQGEGEGPLVALMGGSPPEQKHFVPDYDFARENQYLAPARILPFRASIGCYWSKCRFCPEKAETRPYTAQRAAKTIEDLVTMTRRHHPEVVHLIDNAVTPSLLRAMARKEFPFKWYGFVRFEKDFQDPQFCRDLKKSGCEMLKLGLESGDQGVLDQMNKGTDLTLVSKTLENLTAAGILTFVYLLFGTSFENEDAARRTLAYVQDHQDHIDYLNLAVFNLPKFSQDAQDLVTWDFYHGDLSLYLNFDHPHGWDRRLVKGFINKEFKRTVGIGSRFRKNPPFFSSNHAMFFNHPFSTVQKERPLKGKLNDY